MEIVGQIQFNSWYNWKLNSERCKNTKRCHYLIWTFWFIFIFLAQILSSCSLTFFTYCNCKVQAPPNSQPLMVSLLVLTQQVQWDNIGGLPCHLASGWHRRRGEGQKSETPSRKHQEKSDKACHDSFDSIWNIAYLLIRILSRNLVVLSNSVTYFTGWRGSIYLSAWLLR